MSGDDLRDTCCPDLWDRLNELESENDRLRQALIKLRDCNFVISLPDRMDSVREIARKALSKEQN